MLTQNGFGEDGFGFAPCLLQGQNVRWSDLELALSPGLFPISLVERLAAGAPDLQHEPPLPQIKQIELGAVRGALDTADNGRGNPNLGHLAPTSSAVGRCMLRSNYKGLMTRYIRSGHR